MSTVKYASKSALQTFLDNLKSIFSALVHTHSIDDITDYRLDSQISAESANPVTNSAISAKFDEMKTYIDDITSVSPEDIDNICGSSIQIATLSNEVSF